MDCLDADNLELQILQVLAVNIAETPNQPHSDVSIITRGLPEDIVADDEDTDEIWDETSRNHVISYCHYVQALTAGDSRLSEVLPTLRRLLAAVWTGGNGEDEGTSTSSGSGRVANHHDREVVSESLLWALCHIGHIGTESMTKEAVETLLEHFTKMKEMLASTEKHRLALALTLLETLHRVTLTKPLPLDRISGDDLQRILVASHALATDNIISNLDPDTWERRTQSSSLVSSLAADTTDTNGTIHVQRGSGRGYQRGHPSIDVDLTVIRRFSGMRLVVLVLDIQGVILSAMLVTGAVYEGCQEDGAVVNHASSVPWHTLMSERLPTSGDVTTNRLGASESGRPILEMLSSRALRWWEEVMHGSDAVDQDSRGIGLGVGVMGRGHMSPLGSVADQGEYAVIVATLKLLTLSSLHAGQVDHAHYGRLRVLLSDKSAYPWLTPGLLEMALACVQIFVLNFPHLASSSTQIIRRFAIARLAVIENESYLDYDCTSEPIDATARCLAVCVQAVPGDDSINSTMYTLVNASSQGAHVDANSTSSRQGTVNFSFDGLAAGQRQSLDSDSIYGDGSDNVRRSVAVNAIAMVAKLALQIDRKDVINASTSMLIQRLLQRTRALDGFIEATIVTNLVPLALRSDDSILLEVVRSFTAISKSSDPENPKHASSVVIAAQTTLARGLQGRGTVTQQVLGEYLALFAERGSHIQSHYPTGGHRDKEKDLEKDPETQARIGNEMSHLAALLYPIDAVMSVPDWCSQVNRSHAFVTLFRNMWFLCALFGFTRADSTYVDDSTRQALKRIASRTPALLLETERDYVASSLEYNSILRRNYAAAMVSKQRSVLSSCLPRQATVIKSLSLPQVTFLQTVHDVEQMRMESGHPSVLLDYFCNESVNESEMLSVLDAIADKILHSLLAQMSSQVLMHTLPSNIPEEVRKMLIGTTHRYAKVREVALKMSNTIITSFAALMCNREIVFTLLEILTLMRRSCEDELTDEYSVTHVYRSERLKLELVLTDDFAVRNDITTRLYSSARKWLSLATSRAPIEMQSILQYYLRESRDVLLLDNVEMGAGLALHFAKAISPLDRQESATPNIAGWPSDSSNLLASQSAAKQFFSGEVSGVRLALGAGLTDLSLNAPAISSPSELLAFRKQMAQALKAVQNKTSTMKTSALRRLLLRAVAGLISAPKVDQDILHYLVFLPIRSFTSLGIAAGVDAWTWLIAERPSVQVALLNEIASGWLWTIRARRGLFSNSMDFDGPFQHPIEYSPTDKKIMDHELSAAKRMLKPHLLLIQVIASRFQAVKYREPGIMVAIIRLLMRSFKAHKHMSTHPLAREVRFSLVLFGFQVLSSCKVEIGLELRFRDRLYQTALSWFGARPLWSYGSNRVQLQAEMQLLHEVLAAVQNDQVRGDHFTSSFGDRASVFPLTGYTSLRDYTLQHSERSRLLQLLIESEISRLTVWSGPSQDVKKPSTYLLASVQNDAWPGLIRRAWLIQPAVAIHMAERFKIPVVHAEVVRLVNLQPKAVIDVPEALYFLLGDRLEGKSQQALQWLPLWSPVPPVTAINYFQPRYGNHPLVLQYALRALEQYPVELTFFFVPQVVQALRSDALGYVERFIFETSKISQLFCHQIIWNMKANCYKDDAGEIPDPMKPVLDRMVDMVVAALSGKAKEFYDREFGFFNEVTSISGKLKPFIKKSKPEKKAKIDEEMAKIEVSVGVYLPSNPDGVVVELDKKSGRPLQSHAKAPFMATFKVRKERTEFSEPEDGTSTPTEGVTESAVRKVHYEVWQAAIFKVGDDCRQDVLALQLIAMFKNIFTSAGLMLYLFPYRVTATAPGCGVIDVVPNATSRDEMGRAKINDLFSYFVDKYGSVDSTAFQQARLNFVQSMAAYSVACYILQIKDRHNGNIMIDGEGHIVHIDFGFLFDIDEYSVRSCSRLPRLTCVPFSSFLRPGGVKFEPNSFKLNHEMVVLMGGRDSQGYRLFTDLTVKAFLAIRPFADQLVDTVHLMLGTGLPSFKGEPTIKRLRDRFQLQLGERAAAEYMVGVIRNAHENYRSTVYDGFQKAQNGIPY